jgi:hypothetical protein
VADTFVLTINTGSDAFVGGGSDGVTVELRRILLDVADRLEEGRLEGTLRDHNGNTCGLYGMEPEGARG